MYQRLFLSVLGLGLWLGPLTSAMASEPRRVAITIDDLPWVEFALSSQDDVRRRHLELVDALADADTQAIGFVNEDKLYQDGGLRSERVQMLKDWLVRDLPLGNHTFGHVGLHRTGMDAYEQSILDGEKLLRPLAAEHGQSLAWFRHPYLQAGRDDADRARLARFLDAHGYRIAPVTIDTSDWVFARAYIALLNRGENDAAEALIPRYQDYIEAKFAYYEDQSRRLFGREIPQILLLHANALNAQAMPEMLRRMRKRGYVFDTLESVMSDSAYAHADGYRGAFGFSWIHRWAQAENQPSAFYAGEPKVPTDIMAVAGVDSE